MDEQLTFEPVAKDHPYHVTLDVFEGPLDLLLHLIKENNVDIFNIPVAKITDQYLSYIEAMQTLNLNIAGEFLLMAASLAHIKSKLLLPPDPTQEDPEDEGKDPRAELVRRLLEYQKYKHASENLFVLPQLDRDVFIRVPVRKAILQEQPVELAEVSVFKLVQSFHKILENLPTLHTHDVGVEQFSIRDCALEIESFIRKNSNQPIYFSRLFENEKSYPKVVATFLAVLAMIKRGVIQISQPNDFDDILLTTTQSFTEGAWSYDGAEFDEQHVQPQE